MACPRGSATARIVGEETINVEELERQIEQAVHAGISLDAIKAEVINPALIDEHEQAALWLYAQALHARHEESIEPRLGIG